MKTFYFNLTAKIVAKLMNIKRSFLSWVLTYLVDEAVAVGVVLVLELRHEGDDEALPWLDLQLVEWNRFSEMNKMFLR